MITESVAVLARTTPDAATARHVPQEIARAPTEGAAEAGAARASWARQGRANEPGPLAREKPSRRWAAKPTQKPEADARHRARGHIAVSRRWATAPPAAGPRHRSQGPTRPGALQRPRRARAHVRRDRTRRRASSSRRPRKSPRGLLLPAQIIGVASPEVASAACFRPRHARAAASPAGREARPRPRRPGTRPGQARPR